MTRLKDKKAVVVGGTHGMGFAVVRALLDGGADVALTGASEANLSAAQRELGPRAHALRCDLTRMADIEALRSGVAERLGQLDFLFINAGYSKLQPCEAVDEATYDRTFAINTKGAFFTAQRLLPLVRDGGAVVFTTVTESATGSPEMGVYMAAKAAVRAYARVLAAELLPRNIRVNCVGPGFIRTKTMGVVGATPEERAAFEQIGSNVTPMKRNGTPDEVARAALFLAFEATFTTGMELPVDGGLMRLEPPATGSHTHV